MAFRMAESESVASIKVIGLGGGGGNAVNTMVKSGLREVEFIVANTDRQALDQSMADVCVQLGPGVTKGLGAGADPEVGEQAAIESVNELKEVIKGSDMIFVTAGLGGGTGTGAAPVVAKLSKEMGVLTVSVVTKPFGFEGKLRMKKAVAGWEELKKHSDTIITIPNERLLSLMNKSSKLSDMLTMADTVLLHAVKGITDLINVPGMINADFADLRKVMREVGPAIMGSGSAVGESRAVEAAKRAIDNQLLEDIGIDGARGLLINISAAEDTFGMHEFEEASSYIQSKVDEEAEVVIGALFDDNLGEEMRVTVIATGIDDATKKNKTVNRVDDLRGVRAKIDQEKQNEKGVVRARAHRRMTDAKLPGSSFDSYSRLGVDQSRILNNDRKKDPEKWSEEDLDTPTFLRKNTQ